MLLGTFHVLCCLYCARLWDPEQYQYCFMKLRFLKHLLSQQLKIFIYIHFIMLIYSILLYF